MEESEIPNLKKTFLDGLAFFNSYFCFNLYVGFFTLTQLLIPFFMQLITLILVNLVQKLFKESDYYLL